MKNNKNFKIVITGLGGQGIISLAKIIATTAMHQGYDVKMSELHGLSQRMGHAESHVIFGEKVYSSLVGEQEADLIIALEPLEAMRTLNFASKKTAILLNNYTIKPVSTDKKEYPDMNFITDTLKSLCKELVLIDASKKLEKEINSIEGTNIFMLGYASAHALLPLKKEFLIESIKEVILKNQDINLKIFEKSANEK